MLEFNIIAPELQAIREELEDLWKRKNFEKIRKIKGIEQIADAEEYAEEYDCCAYALPDLEREALIQEIIRIIDLPPVRILKQGDLAVYFRGMDFTHMGVLQGNGCVISKWNDGPVFKHKVFCVPTSFGNRAKIVRK